MRVALLMNFVAPYRVELFEHLRDLVGEFRVLASTPMESDRHWVPDWGTLDVVVQRNLTLRGRLQDRSSGFNRMLHIHLPYDTIPQLLGWHPEAVITAELGMRSLQAVLFKLLRPSVPLLVWCLLSEHTERNWGGLRQRLRRFILRHADMVLVNGESGARYIARFGVPDARIVRLNQPINVARFAAAVRSRSRVDTSLRLLHVGILDERKGVVRFARSLAKWARSHPARSTEITWLGDGEKRAELEALAWPPNLRPIFRGNLPYAEVPAIYAASDILVFPTLADEWGLVVNEAMACGLAVLGSMYSQAVDELVVEGESGWIFDPLLEDDVASALDRALATSPERLTAMGETARRRIEGLTPQSTAERIAAAVRTSLVDGAVKHDSKAGLPEIGLQS